MEEMWQKVLMPLGFKLEAGIKVMNRATDLFLQIVGHKNNQQENKGEFLPFRLWLGFRTFAKETCCLAPKQIVEAFSFQVIQTCQPRDVHRDMLQVCNFDKKPHRHGHFL